MEVAAPRRISLFHTRTPSQSAHPSLMSQVTVVKFSQEEELLWAGEVEKEREGGREKERENAPFRPRPPALNLSPSIPLPSPLLLLGTASGALIGVAIPSLDMQCSVRLHPAPIVGLAPLGAAVLALSPVGATVHSPGGLHAAVIPAPGDPDLADLSCCALEPGAAGRVVAGRAGGGLVSIDAGTGAAAQTAGGAESGVSALASGPRGLLAAGTPAGRLLLIDPRSGWRAVADVACHPGPLTTLAWSRDLVASAGCAPGAGPGSDPQVRVWDVRAIGPARSAWRRPPPPCPAPCQACTGRRAPPQGSPSTRPPRGRSCWRRGGARSHSPTRARACLGASSRWTRAGRP